MISSGEDLATYNNHARDRLFRFILNSATFGQKILRYAPDGWRQGEVKFERDSVYHGVFRQFTTNQLSFVKDGRDYLKKVYEAHGISALCMITVEIMDYSTYEYQPYFVGRIDFSTYRQTELMVECQVMDNSFTEQFKSRDEIEFDLLDDKNVNGMATYPITVNELTLKPKPQFYITTLEYSGATLDLFSPSGFQTTYVKIPYSAIDNDFEEFREYSNGETAVGTGIYAELKESYPMRIFGKIKLTITSIYQTNISGKVSVHATNPGGSDTNQIIATGSMAYPFGTSITFTFDSYFDSFTDGDISLRIELNKVLNLIVVAEYDVKFSSYLYFQGIKRTALPVYEAFFRLTNKMITTGSLTISKFYSEFFGREDTPLMEYQTDGETQFITRGLLIRNKQDINPTMPVKFRDLFSSLTSIWNLGAGIEYIGDDQVIRIEPREYWYSYSVILDVTDRLRSGQVELEVIPDMFYNEINVGYSSYLYETKGGLDEYNTKSVYSTVLDNIKNQLSIISTYRGDTAGIDSIRKSMQLNKTEDTKGDEDIFIIDAIKENDPNTGQPTWYARHGKTSDGFSLVSGGLGADYGYNLRLTPKRNLLRWYWVIVAGLTKNIGSYIRWQTSSKYTELQTQLTTESAPVKEDSHLKVGLLTNRWTNEKLTFECPLYWNEVQAISANPKGMIKCGDNLYGWILSVQTSSVTKKAKFELLKVNIKTIES